MSIKFIRVLSNEDHTVQSEFFCEWVGQDIPPQQPWQIRLEIESQNRLRALYQEQEDAKAYSLKLIDQKLKPRMREELKHASLRLYGTQAWRRGVNINPVTLLVDDATASFAFEWVPTENQDNQDADLLGEIVVLFRVPLSLSNVPQKPGIMNNGLGMIGCFPLIKDELHIDDNHSLVHVSYHQKTVNYLKAMRDNLKMDLGQDVVAIDEDPSNYCFVELPNFPFVHLVFHGPNSKNSGFTLPHNTTLSGDEFVDQFIKECNGKEWPQCLVLTVCGAAREITCRHIERLLTETPLRNILISPLAIPVEEEVFAFYGQLYKELLGGAAMSSAFRKAAENRPTVGLMHCLWGADHTYITPSSTANEVETGARLTADAEATVRIVKADNENWKEASKVEGKLIDCKCGIFDPQMIRHGLRVNDRLPPVDGVVGESTYQEMKRGADAFFRYRLQVSGGGLCIVFPKAQSEEALEKLNPWVTRLSFVCAPEPGLASIIGSDIFQPYDSEGDRAFYVLAEDVPESAHSLAALSELEMWCGRNLTLRLRDMTSAGEMLCRALHRLQEFDLGVDDLITSIRVIVPELIEEPNQAADASVRGFVADSLIHLIPLAEWEGSDPKDEINDRLQVDGRHRWRPYRVATLRELAQELLYTALGCDPSGLQTAVEKLELESTSREAAARLIRLWRHAETDFDTFDQAAMMLHAPYGSAVEELRTLRRAGRRLFLVQNLHEDAELIDALVAASGGQPRHLAAMRNQDWQAWLDVSPPPSPLLIDGMDVQSLYLLLASEDGIDRLFGYLRAGGHLIVRDSADWFEGRQTVELRRFLLQLAEARAPDGEHVGSVVFCDLGTSNFLADRTLREHLSPIDGDLRSDRDIESVLVVDDGRYGHAPMTSSQIHGLAREMRGFSRRSSRDLSRLLRVKNLLPPEDTSEGNDDDQRERRRWVGRFVKQEFAACSRVLEFIETDAPPAWLGYNDIEAYFDTLAKEVERGWPIHAGSAVVVGIPGTDPARTPPWVAARLGVPCFRLNVVAAMVPEAGVLRGLRLGLQRLGRLQGCVLWIDGFVRTLLRNEADTYAQRLLGTLLYWLQEEAPTGRILTLATDEVTPSNHVGYERDLRCLRHEFTRDGRFNRRFFLKAPSPESVKAILDAAAERLMPKIKTEFGQKYEEIQNRLTHMNASPAMIRQSVAEIALNHVAGEADPFAIQLAVLSAAQASPPYAIPNDYHPID